MTFFAGSVPARTVLCSGLGCLRIASVLNPAGGAHDDETAFSRNGLSAGCIHSGAIAQAELKTFADKDGLNVQALTCAQLAGTFQEDADLLTTWYSGWCKGLAKKHDVNVPRSRERRT
jgi:hypothetical protein